MNLSNINWKNVADRWTFVQRHEDHRRRVMQSLYREWFIDVAFMAGQQNVYHDRARSRVNEMQPPSWRVRSISNIVLPAARTLVSNLARVEPVWQNLPATRSQDDLEIAALNTDVLHHYWQQLKVYYKYIQTLFWTASTGNGFLKAGWDADLGDEIQVSRVSDDGLDELFEILGVAKGAKLPEINTGDQFVDVVSPFNLTMQPGALTIEDSLYSIETNIHDQYELMDKYGSKAGDLTSDQTLIQTELFYLEKLQNLTGSLFKETTQTVGPDHNKIVTYECYVRPHKQLKEGLHFIMAQGKDLKKPVPFPYKHKMLPYAHFPEIPIPGSFWGTSSLHQTIPNQVVINKFDSQVSEYIQLMLKGKWLVRKGSGIGSTAITDMPGEVIFYNGNAPPQQARLLAFPRSIFDQREILKRSMQDTASNHDPSQGKVSGSVRSGALAQELKEGDLAVLGPTQLIHDVALSDLGKMVLSNASQFVREDRILSVVRDGHLAVSRSFTGEMLKGSSGGEYFQVIIPPGGRAPWNKLGHRQLIVDLIDKGVLRPGVHDSIILKAVGLDSAKVLFEQSEKARAKQNEENKRLDQGQPVEVQKSDQHDVHLEVLRLKMEDPGFEDRDDRVKEGYRTHFDHHMEMGATMQVLPEVLRMAQAQKLAQALGIRSTGDGSTTGRQSNRNRSKTGTGAK